MPGDPSLLNFPDPVPRFVVVHYRPFFLSMLMGITTLTGPGAPTTDTR
jgi:hypothetical protein